MDELLEYCTDLLTEDGFLDESFNYNTIEEAKVKEKELHSTEMSGLFVQVWHRESENNPICITSEQIK